MSLYYEAAELLTSDVKTGGSLKSRIFSKKDLKSQPAQIYALAIETCKWSSVLKEVIEKADFLRIERKVTPTLSLFLVHDLLLAKKGIALPATHGLRASVERHKNRLQAEFTKARIRRKLGSIEAFKEYIEAGLENAADTEAEAPYPRWVRINTLKTAVEDQLESTFAGLEQVTSIAEVRKRGAKRVYIDAHIPNLVAISANVDLTKSEAYKSGAIIFQDKASCFPAYLLDPLPEDGDLIDTCSAPGNKTTHLAAILLSRSPDMEDCSQKIFAFEKNKGRAETLEKMVNLAGSEKWTKIHPGQDFLKTDPTSSTFKNVGALLLDPSCSGSGIVGRDDVPELHIPELKVAAEAGKNKRGSRSESKLETRKRKREDPVELEVMVDDDGEVTAVNSEDELKARLEALSKFQLELLLHSMKFPAARKITYSTCSIHAQENELVIKKALESKIAQEQGWRILKRGEQVRGMKEWPVRGLDEYGELAEACIRAHKGDQHGTMGFFVAGFVRDELDAPRDEEFLRDEKGHMIRDVMDVPVRVNQQESEVPVEDMEEAAEDEEWGGFEEEVPEPEGEKQEPSKITEKPKKTKKAKTETPKAEKPKTDEKPAKTPAPPNKKRPNLGLKPDKKRRKGK